MEEHKRALRRWKSECKFEKRLKIWVPAGKTQRFMIENHGVKEISSIELKDKIRKGEYWTFLRWSSTPCSCSMCSYPKYERVGKNKINKQIWDDIQDDLAS